MQELVTQFEIDTADALERIGWSSGDKIEVVFPDGLWKNPVYKGTGRRVQNPAWSPGSRVQRYHWQGSPVDKRVPYKKNYDYYVKYMKGEYKVSSRLQIYSDNRKTILFYATNG